MDNIESFEAPKPFGMINEPFFNYNEFCRKTANKKMFFQLKNGWCINATRKAIKQVYDSMKRNNKEFRGVLNSSQPDMNNVQIKID